MKRVALTLVSLALLASLPAALAAQGPCCGPQRTEVGSYGTPLVCITIYRIGAVPFVAATPGRCSTVPELDGLLA